MNDKEKKRLSKFLSLILRHKPQVGPITLDDRGFCAIDELLTATNKKLPFAVERKDIIALTEPPSTPNEKRRFELEGNFVRAGHGHSVEIKGYRQCKPIGPLFHATPTKAVSSIQESGLKAMRRERVHLSYDKAITVEAARRQSKQVTLVEVNIEAALAAGVEFYESADERIVLSTDIPPNCLTYIPA